MSMGGWLVVMDRAGRDVKHYRLRAGSVTLGSDPACDIRVMVPTVSPHHATVSALYHQTVVRSVSERETLVNGAPVSVAALRHGDVISLGDRSLRWEYRVPGARRPLAPEPALLRRVQRARAARRGSDPPPRKVIVPEHRATMPASTSGKQVAIVQPQRRDTSDLSDAASPRLPPTKRQRVSRNINNSTPTAEVAEADGDRAKRKSGSPRTVPNLSNTTKATLWIESRKTSPRKSGVKTQTPAETPVKTPATRRNIRKAVSAKKATPLRMVVLKKSQSVHKMKVTKIQAPLKMDSTKQAAIMLMTRHTPKSKQTSPNEGNKGPSFVVKKPSPVRETPRNKRSSGKRTTNSTPMNYTGISHRLSATNRNTSDKSFPSIIEIIDSESQSSTRESNITRRLGKSSLNSPQVVSPKKSALKDPNAKRSNRKTESIKFDLSNLDNASDNQSSDVMLVNDTGHNSDADESESNFTLRYSDSSKSPSRKSINSRSRRMLENTLGKLVTLSPKSVRRTLTDESPQMKKSLRGSIILQEALRINKSDGTEISTYSRRTTKNLSDNSWSSTIASTQQMKTLSPRASRNSLESYSIVDLVSMDSNDSIASRSGSVYTSADSNHSVAYGTPGSQNLTSVDTRALGCSTPYDPKSETRVNELPENSARSKKYKTRISNRSSAANNGTISVTTPENTEDATKNITLNSTKIFRASKKRFRIITRQNALVFMDDDFSEDDSSPKSSKRITKGSQASPLIPKNISVSETFIGTPSRNEGMHTPENRHSPVEANTPVLNIRSLLDASHNSKRLLNSGGRRISKRKTIASLRSEPRRSRTGIKSKSLALKRSGGGIEISANFDGSDDSTLNAEEEVVTPKSVAKPPPEGVKNKHSSAKKPQSKRSLIDNLNESDIVKQLFNSPVKRKLSQSMTEFSRRHLLDDDEIRPKRPTRATIAIAERSPDCSLLDRTEQFTPDIFVSPLNTPSMTPNMIGIKRLFQKNTPDNDLRNIQGVKDLLRTPRTRRSIKNDLSNVSGVKAVFAKSPRNRLSDVRVKKIFAASPKNDLRRVSGVKDMFRSQRKKGKSPRNELVDLRGVRTLFKEDNPRNDLRNVSGVKRTLRCNSPRNNFTDVSGVNRMFRLEKQRNELSDVSGVEQLPHEPSNYDSTFDQLLGRPPIRAVYTKSKSFSAPSRIQKRSKHRKAKSLHDLSLITNNVEEWLQKKITETLHKKDPTETSNSKGRKSLNKSRNVSKAIRELQKLNIDTVEGSGPVIVTRTRNSSIFNSVQSELSSWKKSASELYGAHTLPIKKRSLVGAPVNKSSTDRSHKLPIKKRAVVHSTPVKGRVNMTMNASEIGRMSPISSEDKTAQIENMNRSLQSQVPFKNKSPQSKIKPSIDSSLKEKTVEVTKASPRKTRSTKAAPTSPTNVKTRRREKSKGENVRKRRSSIVITKKTPVLGPKPGPKGTRKGKTISLDVQNVPKNSPKKTRSTRGQKSQVAVDRKMVTPKKSAKAKVTRISVVVARPSPKLKPRATRNKKDKTANSQVGQQPEKTKRPRKITITESEVQDKTENQVKQSPEESKGKAQPKRKPRKTTVKSAPRETIDDKSLSIIQTRRTRKAAVETAQTESTNQKSTEITKKTRKVINSKAVKPTEEPTSVEHNFETAGAQPVAIRRRRTQVDGTVSKPSKGKEHATTAIKTATRGRNDIEDTKMKSKRGRKIKQVILSDDNKNTVPAEMPVGRGRKRKNTDRDEPGTEEGAEENKRRITRKAVKRDQNTKNTGKVRNDATRGAGDVSGDKTMLTKSVAADTGVNTRRALSAVDDIKPVNGRKTASVAESVPRTNGRNKRTNVELIDTKDNKRAPTKKSRKAAATPPALAAAAASRASRARRR